MRESISLLCPTRDRTDAVMGMAHSALSLARHPESVNVWVYVDEDDPSADRTVLGLSNMNAVYEHWGSGRVQTVVGQRQVLSEYWNKLALIADGAILGMMGDDIRFRTKGWDDLVRNEFGRVPDRIVFVHGRDGLQDARLGTHGFLHRDWVRAVGRMTGGMFSADWADTWINEIANELERRVYVPGLMTEHLHPSAGKAEWDDLHRERMANGARDDTPALFEATRSERMADVKLLRDVIKVWSL